MVARLENPRASARRAMSTSNRPSVTLLSALGRPRPIFTISRHITRLRDWDRLHAFVGQDLAVLQPDLPARVRGHIEVVGDNDDRDLVLFVQALEQSHQLLRGL